MNLLSLEWKKFSDNSVVRLFVLMFLLTLPVTIFMFDQFQKAPPPFPQQKDIFGFPGIWEYQFYVASWLVFFFLGYVIIYMVTSEVDFKTMRQNIITGLTRKEYFLAKVFVILVIAFISTILYVLICLAFGYAYGEPPSFAGAFDKASMIFIGKYYLMNLAYMGFGLMLAMLIRKSGIAIFFYVTYVIFIEPMMRWAGAGYVLKDTDYMSLVNFLPLNAIEDLGPLPIYKKGMNIPNFGKDMEFLLTDNQAILSSAIYVLIFFGIAYYTFIKRDI